MQGAAILAAMERHQLTWREVRNTLLINLLVWGVICASGAGGVYSDALRAGDGRSYDHIMSAWVANHALIALFSFGLYLALRRWPALAASMQNILRSYLLVLLIFLPLQLLYIAALDGVREGGGQLLVAPRGFNVFLELAWTTGTFTAVTAICLWRRGQQRERVWQQAQTENLQLSLALEQQRMQALRGQLEPHFIFNALNAISAMVRTGDGQLALGGIHRLSDLLRYALAASSCDHVSVREELDFVRDYLALQGLRYGERLQVRLDVDDAVLDAVCPPLLLQPLVENAVRHDLECHEGDSDIHIRLWCDDAQLLVCISNPVTADAPPNPGLGMGLSNTRARLQLAYRGEAALQSGEQDGRFVLQIRMPLE